VWADGSITLRHSPVRRGKFPPEVTRRALRLFRYSPDGRRIRNQPIAVRARHALRDAPRWRDCRNR
jgi:hypothetical protein